MQGENLGSLLYGDVSVMDMPVLLCSNNFSFTYMYMYVTEMGTLIRVIFTSRVCYRETSTVIDLFIDLAIKRVKSS